MQVGSSLRVVGALAVFASLVWLLAGCVGITIPVANFTAYPTFGSVPLTVQFTDLSTGNISDWLWDFGDGTTSTEQNPTHTYTTVGFYTVSLTVRYGGLTPSTVTKENYIKVYEEQIPESTKVVDPDTEAVLESVSEDGSVLVFSASTPFLEELRPGDVLVVGVTPKTPYGLLRRVTEIRASSPITVETVQATLEDAIEEGSFEISKTLTPDDIAAVALLKEGVTATGTTWAAAEGFYVGIDNVVLYDADGNLSTTEDQIIANGRISFNPWFDFGIAIEEWELTHAHLTFEATETAELEVQIKVNLLEASYEVEIARFQMTPIVVMVGWLPVVITPVLSVNVGIEGEVSIGITTGITQEATFSVGLSYDHGVWSPISSFSIDFQWEPPTLSAGCNVRGYSGPQLNLLLYGVVGPYANVEGYLELIASLLSPLQWQLYGGFEADAGFRFEVLSHEIADHEMPGVIGYRQLLAQGTIGVIEIYAGTSNPAAVYKYEDGVTWSSISEGAPLESEYAVLSLVEYNGHLYAGTGGFELVMAESSGHKVVTEALTDNPATGRVYRYEGGTNWTLVGDNLDQEVSSLIVWNGTLYAGTSYSGAKLYRYDGGSSWTLVLDLGYSGIRSMYVWNGDLYLGDFNSDTIWRYDGISAQLVLDGGRSCIWDFEAYAGDLYASAWLGYLYRSSNGMNWNVEWTSGEYRNIWDIEEFQGYLYLGIDWTDSGTQEGQLWRYDRATMDLIWQFPVGNPYEGILSLASDGNQLFIGTGGEAGYYGVPGTGKIYLYDGTGAPELISDTMGTGVQVLYIP